MKPEELKYTKDHLWIMMEGETATIGISDYAQNELGDIVFVEMPEVGSQTTKGENMGSIESVKSVSDLIAPLSGEVAEINKKLEDSPETINSSPYDDGWIVKLKVSDSGEAADLMDWNAYQEMLDSER
ncbi:MAG: glycine cleavage system protein GcvH [Spirochaetota bacterium]